MSKYIYMFFTLVSLCLSVPYTYYANTPSSGYKFTTLRLEPGDSLIFVANETSNVVYLNSTGNVHVHANGTVENPVTVKGLPYGGVYPLIVQLFKTDIFAFEMAKNLILRDISFTSADHSHASIGVNFRSPNNNVHENILIENITIFGHTGNGMAFQKLEATNITVRNCKFVNISSNGIALQGSDIVAEFNLLDNCSHGILGRNGENYYINNNVVFNSGGCVQLSNVTGNFNEISGNVCVNSNPIRVDSISSNVILKNNILANSSRSGITFDNTENCSMLFNTIVNSSNNCMMFVNSLNTIASNNALFGCILDRNALGLDLFGSRNAHSSDIISNLSLSEELYPKISSTLPGNALPQELVTTDFNGFPRSLQNPTVGAYETIAPPQGAWKISKTAKYLICEQLNCEDLKNISGGSYVSKTVLGSNETFNVTFSTIFILGSFESSIESVLILENTTLFVEGNFTLSGTMLLGHNSSITVQSCAQLGGTLILSPEVTDKLLQNYTGQNLTVMTSSIGCFTGNFSQILFNTSTCQKYVANTGVQQDTLIVYFRASSNDCIPDGQGITTWLLIVLVVSGVVLLAIVVAIASQVTKCEEKIFPYRKAVKEWQSDRSHTA